MGGKSEQSLVYEIDHLWYGAQKYIYCYRQSNKVSVPSSELGPSTPLWQANVSPGTKGGGHTPLRLTGWGSPNSDDWRKSLALCRLCGMVELYTRDPAK
jgi:hypothetical protein